MLSKKLEKIAQELDKVDNIVAIHTLEKIALARKMMNAHLTKTAAPAILENMGRNLSRTGGLLTRALVAGIGLGIAGEALSLGHKKIKKAIFEHKKDKLIKEIKKTDPSLANVPDHEISKLLDAGYTVAPDLMENPTIASSFISIGKSLGGKIDPNSLKLYADTYAKSKDKPALELIQAGAGFER